MQLKKLCAGMLAAVLTVPSMSIPGANLNNVLAKEKASAVNDGLLIDFDMNEMEGDAILNKADSKAYKVEGNTPSLVDGKEGHGKALYFDGKSNYANLGKDYQVTSGETTIAAWVKVDSAKKGMGRIFGRGRTAVSYEKELSLYIRDNGTLEAQCPDCSASAPGKVQMDEWQHVAVTNDGTVQKLYVDGKVVATEKLAGPTEKWDLDLLLGTCWNKDGSAPFADHMFQGAMDDVKLYSRALDLEEIQDLAEVSDEGGDVVLPEALYEFTMNDIKDGSGELAGQKVITSTDGIEYPIYGGAKEDDFGIYDKSIMFNGSDSYVDIGKPDIQSEYTMSAWIFLEKGAANSLNKIFGRDRTTVPERMFYIAIRGDSGREGTVDVALDGGGVGAPAGTVPFGQWVHFAVTNNPKESCLYIDGELVATGGGSSTDQSTHPLNMLIGCGYNAVGDGIFNEHAFKGRMDDVRIYNQALTAEQIKKSTEGIQDRIPPEIVGVSPQEGSLISVEGRLNVEYNMQIAAGDVKPQIIDEKGQKLEAEVEVQDKNETTEGAETLVVYPTEKLKSNHRYTYHLPKGVVTNAKGVASQEKEWSFSVAQDLAGDAANSDLDYWVVDGKLDLPSKIEEKDGRVIMDNGLVKRVFDLEQNFMTVEYVNQYTGINLLDETNLQADVRMTLNDQYEDGDSASDYLCYVGGVDDKVPTFVYDGYTVEEKVKEPYHWEYDERMSPPSMKDTKWPADGKSLVVNFKAPENIDPKYAGVKVQVRYEMYDGIPTISKSVNITNEGKEDVIVHRLTTEALPVPTSLQDALHMDSDMNMGNNNHDRNNGQYIFKQWEDLGNGSGLMVSRYAIDLENQVNMFKLDNDNFGPNYRLKEGETFESYKLYELFRSSSYFEWQTLEVKKMYRVLFPQTADAPLIYHCISSDPATLRRAIDEAANAGFTMVLMSFGSGINTENTDPAYMAKYKEVFDYAHSKGIMMGAYMMLTARGGGETHNGIWNTMRCINSETSHQTMENTLTFIDHTGLDCLEIDGSYPGSLCEYKEHGGHEGIEDSVVKQWEAGVRDYYKELRARNVYINAPDWHYMAGASMGVMGYVEAGFNVTPLEQLIYGRAMSYYGTFEKLPAMGWTLVPLSSYQGGSDSSFWPYNEKIMEYDFMVGMNMLSGVVGSYRGSNGLYQEGASQNVMETWGEFYNKYREILNADMIHIAPPLPVDINSNKTKAIDGFLHASTMSEQKGLAAFFNQTGETVTQKVTIPLYYTGLTDLKAAPAPLKGSHYRITDPTRTSGPVGHMGGNHEDRTPGVPEIPEIEGTPTDKKAYVCIGDMDGQEYTIDSNGNIEIEITMEPNTYTWLTVYDPKDIPEDIESKEDITAPANVTVKEETASQITLGWDEVQMNGRDVKEYHIYRNGEYIGKTFTNEYKDETIEAEQEYEYRIEAVHNTVAGEGASIKVSTKSDETAPTALIANALSKNTIQIVFDELLDQESAQAAEHYAVEGNRVTEAKLAENGKSVILTLEKAMNPFEEIKVTVSGIKDTSGNAMAEEMYLNVVFGYLGEFKFEEKDGNVAENTKGDLDGSIQGKVNRTEGIEGKGLSLDGTSTYADLGEMLKEKTEYSIAGWVRLESTEGTQVIAARERDSYDGWRWKLSVEDGKLVFHMNNGKGAYPGHEADGEIALTLESEANAVKAGKWMQYALVQNQDTVTLYLNGEKVAEDTQKGISEAVNPYTLWIGAMKNNAGGEPTYNMKGIVDELTVYNTSLTAEKVKELYDEFATESVSKKTLEYFLNKAKAHLENGDVDDCVESIQKLFEEAIAEGEAVMADANATKEEVTNATVKLVKAIQALGMKAGDKTDLAMAIELAQGIDLSKYVEAGQSEFQKALADAQKVLGDGDAMQKEVDAAWNALVEAISNLRLKADKSTLDDLLDSIKNLELDKYTEESVAVLKKAVAKANEVMADETLSEDEQKVVDDAEKALAAAIDGLQLVSSDGNNGDDKTPENGNNNGIPSDGNKDNNKDGKKDAPKTGDAAVPFGMLALAVLAGGIAVVSFRKKYSK